MQEHRRLGHDQLERLPAAVQERLGRLERALDDGRERHPLAAQLQLPVRDAREVEKLVDQAHHVRDLPLDHAQRPFAPRPFLARVARSRQDLGRARERRERVAELVCQRREELVLPAVHRAQRTLGGAPLGHLGRQRFVHGLERVGPLCDPGLQLVTNAAEIRLAFRGLDRVSDRALEERRVETIPDDVVLGATFHRREVFGPLRLIGDQDHRTVAAGLAISAQEVDAALRAEPAGHEVDVVAMRRHPLEPGAEARGPLHVRGSRHLGDQAAHDNGAVLVGVHEQDAHRCGHRAGSSKTE